MPDAVITRLGIAAGPVMAITALVSIFFYMKYDLDRQRQKSITEQLDDRAAAEVITAAEHPIDS